VTVRQTAHIARFAAALLALPLCGCGEETRVVRRDGGLLGLPGSVASDPSTVGKAVRHSDLVPIDDTPASDELVIKNQDGSRTLVSRNPRHVMYHVMQSVDKNEVELFTEQMLSRRTREDFYQRGLDPREAMTMLRARRDDIAELFRAMPQGDLTPGMYMQKVGDNTFRLEVFGRMTERLSWTFMDVVLEEGRWRLRWFGGEGGMPPQTER
jgi:hypothetical protein